jgi:hypothetical protein
VQRVVQQVVQQAVQRNAYQPRGMTSGGAVVTSLPRTGAAQRLFAGTGAQGFPMGTAYPDVQSQPIDSETANLIHMLVQRANPRLPAPTSDPLLRYAGYTAIRDTFPLTPDTPMSNEEMIALLRLADQQDFQYRVPPGSVPDPPEMQAARARQDEIGDAFARFEDTMRSSRRVGRRGAGGQPIEQVSGSLQAGLGQKPLPASAQRAIAGFEEEQRLRDASKESVLATEEAAFLLSTGMSQEDAYRTIMEERATGRPLSFESGDTVIENLQDYSLADLRNDFTKVWNYEPPINDAIGRVEQAIKDQAERLIETERGQTIMEWLEKFDRPRVWNTSLIGEELYTYTTSDSWAEKIQLIDDPYVLAAVIAIEADPELERVVRHLYNVGYTSRTGRQFTGGQAVWEGLYAQFGDDLPPPIKLLYRLITDVPTDPLSFIPVGGAGARGVRGIGTGIANLPDAGLVAKTVGKGMEAAGFVGQHAATILDDPFTVAGKAGRKAGEVLGISNPNPLSTPQQALDASVRQQGFHDQISAARDTRNVGGPFTPSGSTQPSLGSPTGQIDNGKVEFVNGDPGTAGQRYQPGLRPPRQVADDVAADVDAVGDAAALSKDTPGSTAAVATQPTPSQEAPAPEKAPSVTQAEPTPISQASDAPPTTRLADPPPSVADEFVNPTTGERTPVPRGITPARTPEITRAIARATDPDLNTLRNSPAATDETLLSPVAGRDLLIDDPINTVLASGDADDIRLVELFYNDVNRLTSSQLNDDPFYRRFGWRDSQGVQIQAPMSPQVEEALRQAFPRSSSPQNARNGLVKRALQDIAMLEAEAMHVTMAMRHYFGGFNADVRFARRNANGNYRDESLSYLAERFIKTSDDADAQAIWDVLTKTEGGKIVTDNGQPYLSGLPQEFRDEILLRLKEARDAFQDNRLAPGEAITRAADNALHTTKGAPNPAAFYEQGGYKAEAKAVAKVVNDRQQMAEKKGRQLLHIEGRQQGVSREYIREWALEDYGVTVSKLNLDQINEMRAELRAHRKMEGPAPKTAPTKAAPKQTAPASKQPNAAQDLRTVNERDVAQRQSGIKQVIDDITDPSLGFAQGARPRGAFSEFRQQVREGAVEAADIAAAANIRNNELRVFNEIAQLSNEAAIYLDQEIDWVPPGRQAVQNWNGTPERWSVIQAIDWVENWKQRELGKLTPRATEADKTKIIRAAEDELQRIANLGSGLPIDTMLGKEAGLARKALKVHDDAMSINRQMRLFNPITGLAGFFGDVFGNAWAAVVNGVGGTAFDALNPRRQNIAAEAWDKAGTEVHRAAQSLASPFLRETGGVIPLELAPGFTKGEVPTSGLPSINARVADSNVVVRSLANLATVPWLKRGRIATDLNVRTSAFNQFYHDTLRKDGMLAFSKRVREYAGRDTNLWIERIQAEARRKAGDDWHGGFSPQDIAKALDGVTHHNHDLARAWQSEMVNASKKAVDRTHHIYFSYKNTNADEALRRVFTFHYWQTRAYPMHFRSALRNPVLINMYYKLWEHVRQQWEENELPDFARDMLQFMGGPHGLYGLFSPIGLLLPTTILDMTSEGDDRWSVLKNQINPFIAAAAAALGYIDQPPNLIPSRSTERWIINLMNYLEANGHVPEQIPILGELLNDGRMMIDGAWTEQLTNRLLEEANTRFGLNITGNEYSPFDRAANETDQLNTWVIQVAEELYGPIDTWDDARWAEIDAALDAVSSGATGNALATEAQKRWAMEGWYQNMFAWVPGGTVWRPEYRDDMMRLSDEGWDTPEDERTQEQINAMKIRQLATAADPTWVITNDQYHNLGTPEQQRVWDTYYDIIYGESTDLRGTTLKVWDEGSQSYVTMNLPGGLWRLDEDARRDVAEQWLAGQPNGQALMDSYKAERDTFLAAHPEFEDYTTYQKGVFDYQDKPGGIQQWREEGMKAYPNFQAAMERERERLEDEGYTGAVLEAELDSWATEQAAFHAAIGEPWRLSDDPITAYDSGKDPRTGTGLSGIFAPPSSEGGGSGGADGEADPLEHVGDLREHGPGFRGPTRFLPEGSPGQLKRELTEDIAEWEADNALQERKYGDAWDSEKGQWEKWAYDLDYRSATYPTKTDLMKEYETFVMRGGTNGDTSVAAFIAWLAEFYVAA